MRTQLQLVNSVLRRLREPTVNTVTANAYSQLIAIFVNEGLEMVQEAHDWSALETEVRFDLQPAQTTYNLAAYVADGGDVHPTSSRVTTEKSYLLWNQTGFPHAWAYEDDLDPHGAQLFLLDEGNMSRITAIDTTLSNPHVRHLSLRVNEVGTGFSARVWPIPEEARVIRTMWWTPQNKFAIDGTDNNTPVIVRPDVIESYAFMVAINERGEEMGEPGNMATQRYMQYLSSAIETDMMNRSRTGRYEFTPD